VESGAQECLARRSRQHSCRFEPCAAEPAFSMGDTTYCIWREKSESQWRIGNISFPGGDDPDGSGWMLSILDGDPSTYRKWAEEYYDRKLNADAIKRIYEGIPLAPDWVGELNPAIEFESVLADTAEIGYPTA